MYEIIRNKYEHYLGDVELYSTALWHLQAETRLSALSQQLTANYSTCPEVRTLSFLDDFILN